jgi:hypothetical protein
MRKKRVVMKKVTIKGPTKDLRRNKSIFFILNTKATTLDMPYHQNYSQKSA